MRSAQVLGGSARPDATERQEGGRDLRLEQRMRIGASLGRTGGDDGGVARELLIGPDTNRRKMDERIEPADAARDFDEGIDDRVARDAVELLVRQNECALLCVEARLEIRRQHEPRPEHADERRPDRRIGCDTARGH